MGPHTNKSLISCTLSLLANESYQKIIGENVDTYISQSSASRAIHEVVDVLNNNNIINIFDFRKTRMIGKCSSQGK